MKQRNKNLVLIVLIASVLILPFSVSDKNDYREPKFVQDRHQKTRASSEKGGDE